MTRAALPRPVRAAIVANAPFPLVGSLTGATSGELLQLYAVGVLGVGPGAVGAAFGVAAFAPLLALALTPLAIRHGYRWTMLAGHASLALVVVTMAGLPYAVGGGPGATGGLIALVFAAELSVSAGWGTSWLAWFHHLTPPAVAGVAQGSMRTVATLTLVAGMLVVSLTAGDTWTKQEFVPFAVAVAVLLLGAMGVFGVLAAPPGDPSGSDVSASLRQVGRVLAQRDLRASIALCFASSAGTIGLVTVFLAATELIPTWMIGLILIVRRLLVAAGAPAWGAWSDQVGPARAYTRAAEASAGVMVAMAVALQFDGRAGVIAFLVLYGVFSLTSSGLDQLSYLAFRSVAGAPGQVDHWTVDAAVSLGSEFTALIAGVCLAGGRYTPYVLACAGLLGLAGHGARCPSMEGPPHGG